MQCIYQLVLLQCELNISICSSLTISIISYVLKGEHTLMLLVSV